MRRPDIVEMRASMVTTSAVHQMRAPSIERALYGDNLGT